MSGTAGTVQAALVPDLAVAVAHALQQGGGGTSYLWVALPPDAPALRALSLRESGAEAAAAEEAAQEWQRLLPALGLGPGAPLAALSASLFQVDRSHRQPSQLNLSKRPSLPSKTIPRSLLSNLSFLLLARCASALG